MPAPPSHFMKMRGVGCRLIFEGGKVQMVGHVPLGNTRPGTQGQGRERKAGNARTRPGTKETGGEHKDKAGNASIRSNSARA